MDENEIDDLLSDVADVTRQLVEKTLAPIVSRLAEAEKELAALKEANAVKAGRDELAASVKSIEGLMKAAPAEDVLRPADIAAIVGKDFGPVLARLDALEKRQPADTALATVKSDIDALRKTITELPAPQMPELPDVAALVSAAVAALPAPADGKDADPAMIRAMIAEQVAALPPAEPGKSVTIDDLAPVVAEAVNKAVSALPVPAPGKDADPEIISQMIDEAVARLPPAKDGKNADPVDVASQIAVEVERAVAALPKPQDGKSVTIDDVRPFIDDAVHKAVSAIPVPKDGCGIKEFLIDRAGALVATMEDGRMKNLGQVVGRDGIDADMAALERRAADMIAALPKPRDGKDGFSLDDFDATLQEDGRTVVLSFTRGEQSFHAELGIPTMIYRGVYSEGRKYARGDTVTWGGSLWHCDVEETTGKPDGAEKHWTLAAKRGRDGKDSIVKADKGPAKVRVA